MKKRVMGVIAGAALVFSLLAIYVFENRDSDEESAAQESLEIDSTEAGSTAPSEPATLPNRQSITQAGRLSPTKERTTNTENIMEEVGVRLREYQTDEALNELNGLLHQYEELSASEKMELLTAYATFFLKKGQNADAIFFYEQILLLPDMVYENRLAVLQMLARISIAAEDWTAFLNYNDQYFAEGGGYNWIVTGHLMSAYFQLGNFDAVGQSLLIHFETGIHPEYDGSEEQYQRRYKKYENIPLQMSSPQALDVAIGLAEQFDRPSNWETLAEIYALRNDSANYERVMEIGKRKGFVDGSGNWLSSNETAEL